MSRCDSAAIVPKTKELLPEPETPVNTVSRRLGISTLTSLRLFSRAPCTRITSWLSAMYSADDCAFVLVAVLIGSPSSAGLRSGLHELVISSAAPTRPVRPHARRPAPSWRGPPHV